MVFWITALALAGLVFCAVILALYCAPSVGGKDSDLQIYRDQLAEIDRDLARDLILPTEHDSPRARAEANLGNFIAAYQVKERRVEILGASATAPDFTTLPVHLPGPDAAGAQIQP